MDANRLQNLITDLISEESRVQTALSQMHSMLVNIAHPSHNPTQKAAFSIEFKNHYNELIAACDESSASSLSNSYKEILSTIGGTHYFGKLLHAKIKSILEAENYSQELQRQSLEAFITQRNEFIARIGALQGVFVSLNIAPHYSDSLYEIGLAIPSESEYSTLTKVSDPLKKFNHIIKTISQLTDGDNSEPKITHVNNGSIEFFIEKAPEFVANFGILVGGARAIIQKLKKFEEAIKALREVDIEEAEIPEIESRKQLVIEKEKDQIKIQLTDGTDNLSAADKNELKNKIGISIDYLLELGKDNVKIEINGPNTSNQGIKATQPDQGILEQTRETVKNLTNIVDQVNEFGEKVQDIVGLIGEFTTGE